jgi:hypothetical protein
MPAEFPLDHFRQRPETQVSILMLHYRSVSRACEVTMNNLNRLRLRPSHLILHHAHASAISDLNGMITGEIDGTDGF